MSQDLTTFLEKGQLPATNRERGALLDRLRSAYLMQSTLTTKAIPMTNKTNDDYTEATRTIASNPTKYAPRLVAAAKAALAASGTPTATKPTPAKAPPAPSKYEQYLALKKTNAYAAGKFYRENQVAIMAER